MAVRAMSRPDIIDVVAAYVTVAVFYDLSCTTYAEIAQQLIILESTAALGIATIGVLHNIPCCYDLGLDLERVAEYTKMDKSDVIRLHGEREYTVFAIGFCPGFPYLGHLPPQLVGVPRLSSPRVRVEAGSVGLTGRQTGIYPLERPGGWSLIGRTPMELVNVAEAYFPLRAGDRVRFVAISQAEFARLQGQRLPPASR